MLKPEVLDAMLAAGCTAEQIVAAVKAEAQVDDARSARKREADAVRKRRQREAERNNVTQCHADIAGQGVTALDTVSPKKETSPTPPKEKTTPSQSETIVSSKTPRAALEMVLDAQRAKDVVEMRQRIRKPLTHRGAELLAGQLAQWHDPNEAADAMVLNSWQGFKPEYLQNRQARGSPNRKPFEKHDPFKAYAQELADEQNRSHGSDSRDWDDAQGFPQLTIEHHRR